MIILFLLFFKRQVRVFVHSSQVAQDIVEFFRGLLKVWPQAPLFYFENFVILRAYFESRLKILIVRLVKILW